MQMNGASQLSPHSSTGAGNLKKFVSVPENIAAGCISNCPSRARLQKHGIYL